MAMASPYASGNINESLGWAHFPGAGPMSEYAENFPDVNSSGVFEMEAPTIAGKMSHTSYRLAIYQDPVAPHPSYELGFYNGLVSNIQTNISPAVIEDGPLSGFSDASSIISPATTNSSPSEGTHGWEPSSLTYRRKRSLSDCPSHVSSTRKRSISDAAFSTLPSIPGALPTYDHFQNPSSYFSASHYCEPRLMPPQSNIASGSHSSSPSSTDLPDPFDISYDSFPCLYDGHGQVYLPNEDVMGNGQTSITGNGPFKAQVASPAVQKAAWKKRKNLDGRIFVCKYCGNHLTTKQNLTYHISAHLGKRDYACTKCNKRFTTPHVRTRHENRCRT